MTKMICGADSTSNKCGNNKKNGDQVSPPRVKDHCSNPCLVCESTFHHIAERRAAASAGSTARPFPPKPSPYSASALCQDSASDAGPVAPKAHHALMLTSSVCHSMVVRLKFGRPGSPQKAASIEPYSSALLGALNEITRCR